jgi:hypothetical protein
MGRFAIDPADLLWLPPTMAPCSTSTVEAADGASFLEYPTEAFADLRAQGVDRVVCESKHMGSRAVALVRRHGPGALYTRTGRPFFPDPDANAAVLARLRAASAGILDELAADWVLLDAELLPWSAKALGLIQDQYASVAAAARASLPVALDVLGAAAGRGLPVAALRDRTAARLDRVEAFAEAYRRYCWPVGGWAGERGGLAGIRLAPFAVLASGGDAGGRHHATQDRSWHLERTDRLADADPELIMRTERLVVDLSDEAQVAQATRWWLELTESGGEGMVVKPHRGLRQPPLAAGTADMPTRLTQPGIKCRGREYLRLIYGPDYTEPANLTRLRQRGLHRKRALALREHALGLAALDRVAAGEPLWRVHEAVFAILACESEPVDPRL